MQEIPKGLYFLFNPVKWKKQPWIEQLTKILPYVSVLQLRCPEYSDEEYYKAARQLKKILKKTKTLFIVNNRVNIAVSVGSDGVHVGKKDMPVAEVKKIYNGIIGSSRHTPQSAFKAYKEGADYIGCGPVFSTETKIIKRKTIGLKGFLKVKSAVPVKVIPIGGINVNNISKISKVSDTAAVSYALNNSAFPVKDAKKLSKALI